MDQLEALTLIAELALGVAGFSGVVVALGSHLGDWPDVDRLRLAALLAACVGALFLVLLAIMLVMLGVAENQVWRISSILMAAHGIGIMLTIVPKAWVITRETAGMGSTYSMFVFIPAVTVLGINILAQIANSAGIFSGDPFRIFFAGLVILLMISAVQFLRLLFVRRDIQQ